METKHLTKSITEIIRFNILFNFKHFVEDFFILMCENMFICYVVLVLILLSLYIWLQNYKIKYNQIPTKMFPSFQLKIYNLL